MAAPRVRRPPQVLPSETGFVTQRPQVLAQLAKDISDLITSARGSRAQAPEAAYYEGTRAREPLVPEPTQWPLASPVAWTAHGPRRSTAPAHDAPQASVTQPAGAAAARGLASPGSSTSRHLARAGPKSPREVQSLLSSIENREAALRQKVEQLTEEKTLQQKRLEEEVERLQKSNALLQEQLERLAAGPSQLTFYEPVAGSGFPVSAEQSLLETSQEAAGTVLPQDLKEDFQQQLEEIRNEVTRCAQALQGQESLPSAEVSDIREQLASLSAEVMETARSLVGSRQEPWEAESQGGLSGGHTCGSSPPRPMTEEPLRSSSPGKWQPSREDELAQLRVEVQQLRAQLGAPRQASLPLVPSSRGPTLPARPLAGTSPSLRQRLEALRSEFGQRGTPLPARPPPFSPASVIGHYEEHRQPPPTPTLAPSYVPEVSALHDRLSAVRAEVARVVQDPAYAEDSASPALREQLRSLLAELQDVRAGAAAVAAAAANARALPVPGAGVDASFSSSMGRPPMNGHCGPDPAALRMEPVAVAPGPPRDGRFVDVGPLGSGNLDWPRRDQQSAQSCQHASAPSHSPILLGPHLAADVALPTAGGQPSSSLGQSAATATFGDSSGPRRPPAAQFPTGLVAGDPELHSRLTSLQQQLAQLTHYGSSQAPSLEQPPLEPVVSTFTVPRPTAVEEESLSCGLQFQVTSALPPAPARGGTWSVAEPLRPPDEVPLGEELEHREQVRQLQQLLGPPAPPLWSAASLHQQPQPVASCSRPRSASSAASQRTQYHSCPGLQLPAALVPPNGRAASDAGAGSPAHRSSFQQTRSSSLAAPPRRQTVPWTPAPQSSILGESATNTPIPLEPPPQVALSRPSRTKLRAQDAK